MNLPDDLKFILLKYDGRCRSCDVDLDVGERAHWSPSTSKVWCADCVGRRDAPVKAGPERGAQGSPKPSAPTNAESGTTRTPRADSPDGHWQRLCRYARRCIEAEAVRSLVPYSEKNSRWFFHSGEEELVVGKSDTTPAPATLADALRSRARSPSIMYGWPMVVLIDHHKPMVAPLFSTDVEPEHGPGNEIRLHATAEPEFNPAITASSVFDPSIAEEIRHELGDDLPFGDADAMAGLAEATANLLGLDIRSPLDPRSLDRNVSPRPRLSRKRVPAIRPRRAPGCNRPPSDATN